MESNQPQSGLLSKISNLVYIGLFLIPLFFVPGLDVSIYSAKLALFLVITLISSIVISWSLLRNSKIDMKGAWPVTLFLALVGTATISAFLSGNFAKSFFGTFVSVNSVSFWLLGVAILFATFIAVRHSYKPYLVRLAIIGASLITFLFLIIQIIGGFGLLPDGFLSLFPAALTITVMDMIVLSAVASVLSLYALIFKRVTGWIRNVHLSVIILTLFFMLTLNFFLMFILLAIVSVIYLLQLRKVTSTSSSTSKSAKLILLLVLIVCIVGIIFGTQISQVISDILRINSLDIRPGISSTMQVISSAWKDNIIFGIGPNFFSNIWNMSKPVAINLSSFWASNFSNGYSSLFTMVAETGLLGALSVLIFIGLVVRKAVSDTRLKYINGVVSISPNLDLGLATILLWAVFVFYNPGISVLITTFILTGIILAVSYRGGDTQVDSSAEVLVNGGEKSKLAIPYLLFTILLLVVGVMMVSRITASHKYQQAVIEVSTTGDLNKGASLINRAISMAESDLYYRSLSSIYLVKVQNLADTASQNGDLTEDQSAQLQSDLNNAVDNANLAISYDPNNYLNHVALGSIYEFLARAGVANAIESANQAFVRASELSPTNPSIFMAFARLNILAGQPEEALLQIDNAIGLKPNYANAYYLKAQLELASNNVTAAITSVEAAAASEPQNVGLYFQLGLMKYSIGDFNGAATALENALILVPDYANAKYFLGLSYYNLDRNEEAIQEFQDLLVTNPDNTEVQLILSNLQAGNEPFAGAEPPIDDQPENREELPIDQTQ